MNSGGSICLSDSKRASNIWPIMAGAALWATAIFLFTEIPYLKGYLKTPEGFVFNGQLAYLNDQDMYFSFIRQAAHGHNIFINRLTYLQHGPVFFNLEWLLAGKVMSAFNGSTLWTFEVWRLLATFILIFGFAILADVVLFSKFQRLLAILMLSLGGGFGWFFNILSGLKVISPNPWASYDQWTTGHSFAQILLNPHHSLPLGLLCLVLAFYIKGERSDKTRFYLLAGLLAVVEGLIRPYDLIALCVIIPLFICIEIFLKENFSPRRISLRVLPLIIIMPLLLYYWYLYYFHPVFRYWASQGSLYSIPLGWHILSTGVAGMLCVIRLFLNKKFPLDNSGRLLTAWVISLLFLSHAYKWLYFMPYSTMFGTSIMPPIILLGVVSIDGSSWKWPRYGPRINMTVIAIIIAVNSLSSFFKVRNVMYLMSNNSGYYIPSSEIESFAWLNKQGQEQDVVLSTSDTGHLLGKFTDKRVVVGHPSVSPEFALMSSYVEKFFSGKMSDDESQRFLTDLNVQWVYAGKREEGFNKKYLQNLSGLRKCFSNQAVSIYATKTNPAKCK